MIDAKNTVGNNSIVGNVTARGSVGTAGSTTSDDDDVLLNNDGSTMPSENNGNKPKSIKKKKKKATSAANGMSSDDDDDIIALTPSKARSVKKKKSTSLTAGDDQGDTGVTPSSDNATATTKPKKKKKSLSTLTSSSEDGGGDGDLLGTPNKPKSVKKKKSVGDNKGKAATTWEGGPDSNNITPAAGTDRQGLAPSSDGGGEEYYEYYEERDNQQRPTAPPPNGPSGRGRGPPGGRGLGRGRGAPPPGRGRGPPGGRGAGPASARGHPRPSSMINLPSSNGRGPSHPQPSMRRIGSGGPPPSHAGRGRVGPAGGPRKPQSMSMMRAPAPGRGSSHRVNSASGPGLDDNGSYHLPGLRSTSVMHMNNNMNNNGAAEGRGRGFQPGRGMPRQASAYMAPAGPSNSISMPGRPNSMIIASSSMNNSNHQSLPPPPGAKSMGKSFRTHKPQSILRSSSHRRMMTPGSLHRTSSGPVNARVNPDGTVTTSARDTDFNSSIDEFSSDDDDMFEFGEGDESAPMVSDTPGGIISNLTRSISNFAMDMSGHSGIQGLGTSSRHFNESGGPASFTGGGGGGGGDRRAVMTNLSKFQSTRSVLTLDLEWEDENRFIQFLRYIRILAPHPDEKPIKKRIRIVTWVAMGLDLLAAFVAIGTYNGVTMCCGVPILELAGNFNWNLAIQIFTYLYVALILLEIVPVVRDGFPLNLLNPIVGFLITFAVFFSDRMVFAVVMWVIEATAVGCEYYIFRLRSRAYEEREERLQKTEREIKGLRCIKKKVKKQYDLEVSRRSLDVMSDDGDDGSLLDDDSFHDETVMDDGAATTVTDISKVRELRLLRERRLLRQSQAVDRRHLRYHLIGVAVNIFLVCVSLMLICAIGRNGGLCFVDMAMPNVFKNDQFERCYLCEDPRQECQKCETDVIQCYYPYG